MQCKHIILSSHSHMITKRISVPVSSVGKYFGRSRPMALNSNLLPVTQYCTQAPHRTPDTTTTQIQKHLPKLPVPPLNDTLAKYLRSVKPLLPEEGFKKTVQLVKTFGSDPNLGPKLQSLLENRANLMDNWMAEWWLNTAYLEYRQPVVVYSSPGLVFPLQNFKTLEDQLNYAAKLIYGALRFKEMIDRGEIKTDMMGKAPLDMSQYTKIFGTTRNPAPSRDVLIYNPTSNHIIVAYMNNFYKVNVYSNGNIVDSFEIFKQLKLLVNRTSKTGTPLGLLTSDTRDNWAKSYERLIRSDPINQQSLKVIEQSLFIVSIDQPNGVFSLPRDDHQPTSNSNVEDVELSVKQTTAALQMLHGNRINSGNRWFDKTIGFNVGTKGEVGLTYEHSPAEGPPIANMMDYIVQYMASNPSSFQINDKELLLTESPTLLEFNLEDKEIQEAIMIAKESLETLIQDLNMTAFTFKVYGREFIKSCKLSPDSFIQTAIQAAFYRLHGLPAAHYESASVRLFAGGRTECIRSCSIDSLEFSKALLVSSLSLHEKFRYMKKAIESHKSYAADAVKGHGVDRHLLGLKKIAIENGFGIPEIFLDEGFLQSSNFRLSTSQVPSLFEAFMCYGPLVTNGYGCCYNPIKNAIVFGLSAFNSSSETNLLKFKKALQETLLDMQKVGLTSTLQSKL